MQVSADKERSFDAGEVLHQRTVLYCKVLNFDECFFSVQRDAAGVALIDGEGKQRALIDCSEAV